MGFHAFSLDPRTILGVGAGATLEEIHEAYRAKSKKHHPDRGGDEWAFRMVARAYEVLKTTTEMASSSGRVSPAASAPWATAATNGAGPWADRRAWAAAGTSSTTTTATAAETESDPAEPEAPVGAEDTPIDPSRLRSVDVELIWTRFEKDGPARILAESDADDATLSVCMVLSWPEAEAVDQASGSPGTAETLRALIDLFEELREKRSVVMARSRIEDGRFVGWLSYPDVLTAQDAILIVRENFRTRGLTIKLQTRDERIPFDWHSETHAPVISQAS